MLKKLIKILLFLLLISYTNVNAEFLICNSDKLDYQAKSILDLCNGGKIFSNLDMINYNSGIIFDFDIGYIGDLNFFQKNIDYENYIPIGYFNENKETKIQDYNFSYNSEVGYIGNNFDLKDILIEELMLPIGFFSKNQETKITTDNPIFSQPVGFLSEGYFGTLLDSGLLEGEYTYRDFFIKIFHETGYSDFKNLSYSQNDYNFFIINLVDLLLDGDSRSNMIISKTEKNKILFYIENSNFKSNLSKLIFNLRYINLYFGKNNDYKSNIYLLAYYLHK